MADTVVLASPHMLKTFGFSSQKAAFVSDHLDEHKRYE